MPYDRRVILRQSAIMAACGLLPQAAWIANVSYSAYAELTSHEIEFPTLGSKINLRWYDNRNASESIFLKEAKSVVDHWVMIISDYEPESEVMRACTEADHGKWVHVSEELWSVLEACQRWHSWSNGAFDAALGALTRMRRQKKPATENQWHDARTNSGWNLVELNENKRAFKTHRPGVRLDFGAIGKGWIADRIAEKLLRADVEKYVVNASGNMRIGASPPGVRGWPISVDAPALDEAGVREFARFRMFECGISTSGGRFQRYPDDASRNAPFQRQSLQKEHSVQKEPRSSHVIDPTSKRGVDINHSVFVRAPDAAVADAISTITSVRSNNDLTGWLTTIEQSIPSVAILHLTRSKDSIKSIQVGFEKLHDLE